MKLQTTSLLAAALSATLIGTSALGATVSASDATIIDNDFVNAASTGAVGRNNGGTLDFRALMVFSVADIITNEALVSSIADFGTVTFDFSFDTNDDTKDLAAGTYKVEYLGFFADGNYPDSGNGTGLADWGGTFGSPAAQTVDTGVTDTLGPQADITATGFSVTGVTEADSANDVVLFRIRYDEPLPAANNQLLAGYTLTAVAVPEPGSLALGLIGLGAIAMRRRRG